MRTFVHRLRAEILGVLLLFCLVFPNLASSADVIRMNNGQTIEVRIISENASEVVAEVNGARQEIRKTMIASIERDEELANNPSYQKMIRAEEMIDNNQDAIEAFQLFLEGYQEDTELLDIFNVLAQRLITGVQTEVDAAISNGNGERALLGSQLLSSELSGNIIEVAIPNKAAEIENFARISEGKGHTLIGIGLRNSGDVIGAVDTFLTALGYIQSTDQEYAQVQFLLGMAYKAEGEQAVSVAQYERAREQFTKAITSFESVIQYAASNATLVPQSTTEITTIRESYLPRVNQALASEDSTPVAPNNGNNGANPGLQPQPAQPQPAEEEQAVEEPEPEPEPGFIAGLLGEELGEEFTGFWNDMIGEEITPISVLGFIVGFILLYWIVPYFFLKYRVGKLDIVADQWIKRVWFAGLFCVLGYVFSYIKNRPKKEKETKSKHPCPHCGNGLDDPMKYTTLQFEYCPNCGGEVKSLYKIEDYIVMLADNMNKEADRVEKGTGSMQEFVKKDSMQKLVRSIIIHGSRCRASDIHIEPGKKGMIIRQRVDGVMMEMVKLDMQLGPALVSAIKVSSDLDISEKRKPQDGSMQIEVDDYLLDLRVATSPSQVGEKATLRLLDSRTLEMSTKNLGMTKSARQLFEESIHKPHGLVLVTGPTGSGKTTSLYVAMQTLAKGDKNIISIEDPIEFRLSGVNQIQVNPPAGLTFASGLRSMLRQDPDIIMVGEIRDPETAEIAVNAAQTGHLVLSTLHTIDAASSVTRLYDLKVSPRQFADALDLVVAQRLIRLVCPNCRKDVNVRETDLQSISIPKADYDKYKFVSGKGCQECLQTGYLGRTGIFEMLSPNATIKSFLQKGDFSTVELRELAITNGMRSLREEALVLLRQQMTTLEEVQRVTQ